jgi:hypothetical protein
MAWLTHTTATQAVYPSEPGHRYRFTITARDYAGNVSAPRTQLVLTYALPVRGYLPIIGR